MSAENKLSWSTFFALSDPISLLGAFAAMAVAVIILSAGSDGWNFLLVNGLLAVQPVFFFALRIPWVLKTVAAIALAYVIYVVSPGLLAIVHLGPPLAPVRAKGIWPLYWIYCALSAICNLLILLTRAGALK